MNKYLLTSTITIIIWPSLLSTAFGQVYSCGLLNTTNIVQNMDVSRTRPVIVIGNVSEKPYVVVVPGNSEQLLTQVRKYVKDAFLTQNRLGYYIYAGGYKNRFQAQCWTHLLNSQGIDARVVYFR